eukprot:6716524-Pyramimonas_sp.AAC.1
MLTRNLRIVKILCFVCAFRTFAADEAALIPVVDNLEAVGYHGSSLAPDRINNARCTITTYSVG